MLLTRTSVFSRNATLALEQSHQGETGHNVNNDTMLLKDGDNSKFNQTLKMNERRLSSNAATESEVNDRDADAEKNEKTDEEGGGQEQSSPMPLQEKQVLIQGRPKADAD